ncbi:THAP domain-containing protein 3 isoform X3 [Heterocephalus glaber]|uniref:THAP domain-containing protein 3 isoform X3 n=1 Tax=Heterocephalus glaber TaxID=10181 RepID=A0AAX6QKU3_HETGA|nr:THAP domain-containing protein 3 isoform X3 [Heterocephalus glaber]
MRAQSCASAFGVPGLQVCGCHPRAEVTGVFRRPGAGTPSVTSGGAHTYSAAAERAGVRLGRARTGKPGADSARVGAGTPLTRPPVTGLTPVPSPASPPPALARAGPAPALARRPRAAIFVRGRPKMPKSCAARQCCNRYSSRRKQLTFHRFPFSRPELLKEWVLNIGRADFKPKQHTVICSEHFRPECFSAFGNRKNLKHNAVPTVFAFREPAQAVPLRLETSEAPGAPASCSGPSRLHPRQAWDHSYALLDLDTLKKKLFLTLRENEKLRKRLKAQRLVMRRMCSRLRARGAGPRLQS